MALVITTTSCTNLAQWRADKANCIYPAFVDGMPYKSWGPESTRAASERFYFQLKATGGTTYTWAKTAGSLPDGLSLDIDGKISGTPTKEGTFTFTVQVTSGSETSDPVDITMIADYWRGKRLRDARSGITCHITKQSYPAMIKNTMTSGVIDLYVDEFEAQFTNFNPTDIAQKVFDAGHGFLEFSATWQNMFRMWPSTTYTRYQDHATVNYAGQMVDALHGKNLLALTYFPPDYQALAIEGATGYDRYILTDADDAGNWGGPNTGLIRELVDDLKFDGMAMDIGGASSVYRNGAYNIAPGWLYWDAVLPIIYYSNPWFIFGVNPGTRDLGYIKGGTKVQYPDADFVIYESTKTTSTSPTGLEWAVPYVGQKKMAIYIWNQISTTFAAGIDLDTSPIKTNEGIEANFLANINVGATVAHAVPMHSSGGPYPNAHFTPVWDFISGISNANKNFSNDCKISYSSGFATITTPNRSRIFFTTDGSWPSEKSQVYMKPIPITTNTIIRARALEAGKKIGYVESYQVEGFSIPSTKKLFNQTIASTPGTDTDGYYRGMEVTILENDIMLYGIGRAGPMTVNHDVMIRRKTDEWPMLTSVVKTTDLLEDGFKYAAVPKTLLKAGETYYFCVKEGTTDSYASNRFTSIPLNPDIRINGYSMMSWNGDMFPSTLDGKGQLLNLKYEVVKKKGEKNLLLGAPAVFINNTTGGALSASGSIRHATNATNGDDDSVAQAGGQVAYTIRAQLPEALEVGQVKVKFGEGIATDFEIRTSMTGSNFTNVTVARVQNNTLGEVEVNFTRRTAKFVHLRINQPSIPGTGQASVVKFEAYR